MSFMILSSFRISEPSCYMPSLYVNDLLSYYKLSFYVFSVIHISAILTLVRI